MNCCHLWWLTILLALHPWMPVSQVCLDGSQNVLFVVCCFWLLLGGCWLLVGGCWLVVVGCCGCCGCFWLLLLLLLVVGCWLLVVVVVVHVVHQGRFLTTQPRRFWLSRACFGFESCVFDLSPACSGEFETCRKMHQECEEKGNWRA